MSYPIWWSMVNRFNRSNYLFLIVFMLQMLANGWDAWDDLSHHVVSTHLSMNVLLALLSFVGLLVLWGQFVGRGRDLNALSQELLDVKLSLGQQQAQAAKLMGELSVIIHQQFDLWHLSDAEKEVALLLLKGLSLEEISLVRGRAEKTVRQQASNVYSKASVSGRHALSAYFFEDLLGK